ncbi:MAG: hypothetical protein KGH65_03660 [Candidatus Micrarchaeota archaeon]|nr:hypothetical protein [Candidatus Micrarchaeota archaeon]
MLDNIETLLMITLPLLGLLLVGCALEWLWNWHYYRRYDRRHYHMRDVK